MKGNAKNYEIHNYAFAHYNGFRTSGWIYSVKIVQSARYLKHINPKYFDKYTISFGTKS